MSGPLKFAGFTAGQNIRARDFEDRAQRGPCYIEGCILQVFPQGIAGADFAHYLVKPVLRVWDGKPAPLDGFNVTVPFQLALDDYANRVMLVPNSLFELWTADTVAECLSGVPSELYRRLWNDVLPHNATPYDAEREALDGTNCLADLWHLLTPAEQSKLNELANAEDARNAPPADEDEADHARAWYDTSAELS
jgi:hypothetical protein